MKFEKAPKKGTFMENAQSWLNYGNYITLIIVLELLLIVAIIISGIYFLRYRKTLVRKSEISLSPRKVVSLHELVQQAKNEFTGGVLNVSINKGDYKIDQELTFSQAFRLLGASVTESRIQTLGDYPAIRINDTKDCVVANLRIEGAIQCSNSELVIENCQIIAKNNGICIEAFDGSIVTFSGIMRGEGGIAIRAKGKSKVILKPPYAVSSDDYIIIDPQSEIQFNLEGDKSPEKF